jgi:hypothetical protein
MWFYSNLQHGQDFAIWSFVFVELSLFLQFNSMCMLSRMMMDVVGPFPTFRITQELCLPSTPHGKLDSWVGLIEIVNLWPPQCLTQMVFLGRIVEDLGRLLHLLFGLGEGDLWLHLTCVVGDVRCIKSDWQHVIVFSLYSNSNCYSKGPISAQLTTMDKKSLPLAFQLFCIHATIGI